ncbi:hypothetical protein CJE50_13845 [Salmonella enterica]|nr:hypothetical protein [Salmonella enterica]
MISWIASTIFGHYFCGVGGNRPDGSDEALTIKGLSNVHKKIRKRVSVSGFLHSHWIGQLTLN